MKNKHIFIAIIAATLILTACKGNSEQNQQEQKVSIKEEAVTYSADTITMNGFVAIMKRIQRNDR